MEMEDDFYENESTYQRQPNWKIWQSWDSKIQNFIIPIKSETETQL